MEKQIVKHHKLYLMTGIILIVISLIYIGAYIFYFKEYSAMTFTMVYSFIYYLIARPILFVSLFALITRIIVISPVVNLSKAYSRYARYVLATLTLLYTILMLQYFYVIFPMISFPIYGYMISHSPVLYILIGVFLSLSIPIKSIY